MKKILFKGVGSAVPTPFDEKGVDISEFRKFLQFQIDNNVDALIVCGTTGESSTMTRDEKIIAINCALEVANEKIPVIVGVQIILEKLLKCLKLLKGLVLMAF